MQAQHNMKSNIMRDKSLIAPGTASYISQFDQHQAALPGEELAWLDSFRRSSLARFSKKGFPTQKDEDWRYTPLKSVLGKAFSLVADSDNGSIHPSDFNLIPELDSYRLVFIDGVLEQGLSDISALQGRLEVQTLSDALNQKPEEIRQFLGDIARKYVNGPESNGFSELNNALHQDGFVLQLEDGAILEKPLEVVFASHQDLSLSQPRNLVLMGKGAKAQVIERFISLQDGKTLCNSVTEILLHEQSELDYYLIQEQSKQANQICGVWARQKAGSRFSCRTVTFGGALVRNDLRTEMIGPDAHCDMLGVYSLSQKQHVDNHTTMIHGAENCTSNELYKGVLNQRSRGVFHGRIKVEKGAQKTDAKQTNNTLLLSRDAEIDTKPQLEIYADDVKCAHGATIGQLDETSLFYLRSRGVDPESARSMLTYAFVNDVLNQVQIEPLKNYLEDTLGSQLISEG